jgi:hypothetical protein
MDCMLHDGLHVSSLDCARFVRMFRKGIKMQRRDFTRKKHSPMVYTYVDVLTFARQCTDGQLSHKPVQMTTEMLCAIMSVVGKEGKNAIVTDLFDNMEERYGIKQTTRTYQEMIGHFLHKNERNEEVAFGLIQVMVNKGVFINPRIIDYVIEHFLEEDLSTNPPPRIGGVPMRQRTSIYKNRKYHDREKKWFCFATSDVLPLSNAIDWVQEMHTAHGYRPSVQGVLSLLDRLLQRREESEATRLVDLIGVMYADYERRLAVHVPMHAKTSPSLGFYNRTWLPGSNINTANPPWHWSKSVKRMAKIYPEGKNGCQHIKKIDRKGKYTPEYYDTRKMLPASRHLYAQLHSQNLEKTFDRSTHDGFHSRSAFRGIGCNGVQPGALTEGSLRARFARYGVNLDSSSQSTEAD